MPIKHIAWLKFKDGLSQEEIDDHLRACRGLNESVSVIDSLVCGANFTDRAGGFTHGIIVSVANKELLDQYLNHTAHIPVANALVADLAEIKVMDFEF